MLREVTEFILKIKYGTLFLAIKVLLTPFYWENQTEHFFHIVAKTDSRGEKSLESQISSSCSYFWHHHLPTIFCLLNNKPLFDIIFDWSWLVSDGVSILTSPHLTSPKNKQIAFWCIYIHRFLPSCNKLSDQSFNLR